MAVAETTRDLPCRCPSAGAMPRAESRPESGEWIAVERRRTDGKRKQLSAEAKKNSRNQAGNALSLVDDGLHSYCKNPI